jgi:integrase
MVYFNARTPLVGTSLTLILVVCEGRSVEAHTRTQALDALAAIKANVQRESILGVRQSSDITMEDLLKRFRKHQKTRIRATTFIRLDSILKTLQGQFPVRVKDITRAQVANFVASRANGVSPATIQKEATVLKHALRLAVEWELIHSNPAERVQLPRPAEGRTRYLSPKELRAVLKAAPEWMRRPIALAAFTGMRRGEILSLRWKDVDIAGRRLYLHETKNGTLRVIALNDLAVGVIKSLPGGEPAQPVLPSVDAARLSVYTKRLFASVGIQDASFHSLRHTAASWLVMKGVDLYTVGQVLGHRTPRMTQRYAHLSPQYMANAMAKLETVFSKSTLQSRRSGTPTGLSRIQTAAKLSNPTNTRSRYKHLIPRYLYSPCLAGTNRCKHSVSLFHGDNMGSNPIGDTNSFSHPK